MSDATRDTVDIVVDGQPMGAAAGATVASAMLNANHTRFRTSTSGAPRAPLCAMGICYECRVTIDGVSHQRACLTIVRPAMHIVTGSRVE